MLENLIQSAYMYAKSLQPHQENSAKPTHLGANEPRDNIARVHACVRSSEGCMRLLGMAKHRSDKEHARD